MKDLEKHVLTVSLVAAGVFAAGLAMYAFRTNQYVMNARKGFGAQ